MKKLRTPKLLIILAFLAILTIQCNPLQATQMPVFEEKTLKVGVLGPFTGPSAVTGQQSRDAIKMAFEKIDYMIGNYKIELIWIANATTDM